MTFGNPFQERIPEGRKSEPPPSSRSRLRMFMEEKKHGEDPNIIDSKIERYISSLMRPDLKIGEGQVGDVYCGRTEDEMDGFCIKHNARRKSHIEQELGEEKTLAEEMKLQEKAYAILEEARTKGQKVARVPKAWAYLTIEGGKEILAMERARGKTLHRILLEKAAEKMPESCFLPGYSRQNLVDIPNKDLEIMVFQNFLHTKGNSPETYKILIQSLIDAPFLPTELTIKIRNSIQILNKHRFYHRDLHESNIIISDDLQEIYIIDFGSSSADEFSSLSEAATVERLGSRVVYQRRDTSILSTLMSITQKRNY
jgi:serine/threonine protein kinase